MEDNEYVKHLSIVGRWSPNLSRRYVPNTNQILKTLSCNEETASSETTTNKEEEFLKAASGGDLKGLLNLTSKVVIDTKNSKGQTALICACIANQFYAVKFLLAKHAKVDIFDDTGNTALHHACLKDNVEIVRSLSDKISLNVKNEAGQCILHLAVQKEKLNVLDYLLHSNKINMNEQDSDGNTAVHLAISDHNIKILEKLMGVKNNLSIYNKDGLNPVNLSVTQDDFECLKMMVMKTKDLTILRSKTQFKESNFQIAVRFKHAKIVDFLLNINDDHIISTEIDEKYGYTCLHWATLQINKVLIERILNKNQKLINVKDKNNLTVLEHVVNMNESPSSSQNTFISIATMFIQYDADIDLVENRDGLKKLIKDIFKNKVLENK